MSLYLPPYLFPPVSWYVAGIDAGIFRVNVGGNFVKQSLRSRYRIITANGPQMLSVPVIKAGSRQKMKEVRISREGKWVQEQKRTLQSAYAGSPFYEFYDYRILPYLEDESLSLQELIVSSTMEIHSLLKLEESLEFIEDDSAFVFAEISPGNAAYAQVFEDRHGFQPGLSILDLIFNLGPMAGDYFYAGKQS